MEEFRPERSGAFIDHKHVRLEKITIIRMGEIYDYPPGEYDYIIIQVEAREFRRDRRHEVTLSLSPSDFRVFLNKLEKYRWVAER